jgi:hypothetical protein
MTRPGEIGPGVTRPGVTGPGVTGPVDAGGSGVRATGRGEPASRSLDRLPRWSDLLAAALLGTQRRAVPTLSDVDDPATALLDAAAVVALAHRAGMPAEWGLTWPAPAPSTKVPTVAAAAATRLAQLVEPLANPARGYGASDNFDVETRIALIEEWLEVAAGAGRTVPGELLPALLEAGRRRRELRPLIVAVGGPRAAWLAAQRVEWRYLSGEPAEHTDLTVDDWQYATIGARAGFLAGLRRVDPGGARALLATAWPAEAPEDRALLLAALRVGLSTSDEPLLEQALADRRREVRTVALELLAVLPGAAYGARMSARARRYVRVRRAGRGAALVVAPPEECDAELRRDGVAPRAPAGVNERAWWLEEVLARTPLSTWTGDGMTPQRFLALPAPDEWTGVLQRGLARAAAAQHDAAWAHALIDLLTPQLLAGGRPDDQLLVESLYEALPLAEIAGRAADLLRREPPATMGVDRLLELSPRPWPPELAAAVVAAIGQRARTGKANWRLTELCRLSATRLPPAAVEALPVVERGDRRGDNAAIRALTRLTDTMRFRHEMYEELA